MGQILMIARTNDDARLAVGVERRVVLARSDLVAKASMGMSCFGTMYTYLVRRSYPSLARIESDGDGLPLVHPLARRTGSLYLLPLFRKQEQENEA